jgi:hypothetical protein
VAAVLSHIKPKLDLLGSICGALGGALSVLAVGLRIVLGPGNPAGVIIAPRSILMGGIALLVFACLLKLTAR